MKTKLLILMLFVTASALAQNRVLSLPGDTSTIEGGELIVIDGKIVGAIGVSGVQANQDGEIARAGVGGVK